MLSVFNNQQTLEAATFLSLCVSSPASSFSLSCFFNVTLFRILPVLFLTYFTLLLSSPFQRLNSCDRPSFEQGNAQGQQLSEGHWSRLCSSVRGIAENYTAIKAVTVFLCRNIYIYIYMVHRAGGCIMAVEVLYEGGGATGSAATCPAWKWALSAGVTAEGSSQETVEKGGDEESIFSLLAIHVLHEITDICRLL